ncbi:methyltransferase domain-containing protein [Ruegeria sediminis]|uniref:Methyltransferase domain-containing protein n=1 Tax=Ruegeria sediminis TaxID=2583820 RepID=A0ABY2X2R4_9RHOB|nr:methyltransferase domain-containing protein [Ruegeria sediminis]TMV09681.1 methyltransferase domain-containing protein [Ruegeria sediminis]
MSENDKVFAGSIPDYYDEYLVPLIFESYARDLARRVVAEPVKDVLETAAGSGVVTRALAPLLPQGARYCVTDLNPPMLERAKSRQPTDPPVEWLPADALHLPFEDQSFDAVCCQFGVMFFPDRVTGYSEARRVLRPGGRFLFNVWDTIAQNEFADIVTHVARTLLPEAHANFLARTPHGHGNPERIRAELEKAGFRHIEIETVSGVSTAADPSHPAIAYVRGTPLYGELAPHGEKMLNRIIGAATEEIRDRYGEGEVSAKIQGFVITAS